MRESRLSLTIDIPANVVRMAVREDDRVDVLGSDALGL
jgi:hypothetical protein